MKKLFIITALICTALPALAQHHGFRHHGHHGHHRGPGIGWWVAPVVIGAIGYELGRQQTVVVQQQPVIVQNPPIFTQQENCTPWKEIQTPDGKIYRERTCTN
jgi:hypothetical protein